MQQRLSRRLRLYYKTMRPFLYVGKFIGNSVEPRADTRTWNNLPQHLSFAALQLPAGEHPATVDFLDTTGAALPDRKKSVLLTVQAGRDTVVLMADR